MDENMRSIIRNLKRISEQDNFSVNSRCDIVSQSCTTSQELKKVLKMKGPHLIGIGWIIWLVANIKQESGIVHKRVSGQTLVGEED